MPCVSVVVSGDFCRFKLALPSLLSMSKDEGQLGPPMLLQKRARYDTKLQYNKAKQ